MMSVIANGSPCPSDASAPPDNGMSDALVKHDRQLLKAKAIPRFIKNVIEEFVVQMSRLY